MHSMASFAVLTYLNSFLLYIQFQVIRYILLQMPSNRIFHTKEDVTIMLRWDESFGIPYPEKNKLASNIQLPPFYPRPLIVTEI